MANNRLILRTLTSPWIVPVADFTKNSVLSHDDVDNNFIYLKGQDIYSVSTAPNLITLNRVNGDTLSIPFSGVLNSYTTGTTIDGNIIHFDRTDTLSAYTVDLSGILSGITLTDGNGTTANGSAADLGGVLNKNTTISGASYNLTFGDSNSSLNQLDINSILSTQTFTSPGFNSVVVAYQPGLLTRTVSNTASTETNVTTANSLQYRTDITKASTNEHSWFNLQENDITLKAENTSTGAYTSSFISQNSYQLLHNNGSSVNNQLFMSDNNVIISHTSGGTTNGITINEDMLYLYGPTSNLVLNTTGSTFTDTRAVTKGIEYSDDYSTGFTDNTLITKKYVDDAVSAVTSGLTADTNTYVTGLTYDNANNITLSQNGGEPDKIVNISTMTGLTVNGTLSATTIDASDILSGGTNLSSIFQTLAAVTQVNLSTDDLVQDAEPRTYNMNNNNLTFSNGYFIVSDSTFGDIVNLNHSGGELFFGGASGVGNGGSNLIHDTKFNVASSTTNCHRDFSNSVGLCLTNFTTTGGLNQYAVVENQDGPLYIITNTGEDLLFRSGSDNFVWQDDGGSTDMRLNAGVLSVATWEGVTVKEGFGGTAQSSYATGDMLYASAANTLSKLTAGSEAEILTIVGGVPVWAPNVSSGNSLTTGATVIGNVIYFDRNDALSAYTADLSSIAPTGLTADDIAQGTTNFFITDGDKGDVTVSNSGATWTINDSALKYTTGTTLVGTTLYFDRSDTLSAYTADLSSIAGGSGSTVTASNGLTKVGDDIQLGGILSSDTAISGASQSINFGVPDSQLANFNVHSVQGNIDSVSGNLTQNIDFNPTQIRIQQNDTGNGHSSDYNFINAYFNIQAQDGVAQAKSRIFGDTGTLRLQQSNTGETTYSRIDMIQTGVTMVINSVKFNELNFNNDKFDVNIQDSGRLHISSGPTSTTAPLAGNFFADFRTGTTQSGLEYAADYSANFNPLSLITKQYFDNGLTGLTADDIASGTTNFFLTDGDKGDITVSNSGTTWTIDNFAVTTGKIAQYAVTLTRMEQQTAGGLISYDGDNDAQIIPIGTSGHVLTSNGTGTTPTWQAIPGGGGGEVNTASNIGGGEGIFSGKSGVDLQFKSLTSTGNSITISSTGATVNLEADNATDPNAIHDNVNSEISAITAKGTLVNADIFLIEDTEASNAKKKTTLEDIKNAVGSATGGTPGIQTAVENFYIATANNQAATTGSQYSSKVIPLVNRTVSSMAYFVAAASASRTVYVGIYDNAGNKLAEGSGNTDATGVQTATLSTSVTLSANTEYFFSILEGSGVPNFAQTSTFGIDKLSRSTFISTTPTGLAASIAGHPASTTSFWLKAF